MTNRRERKREFRQPTPWRRLLAFLCAFELLISVSGETAYAKNDNIIYSAPVTAPIRNADTPQPEEAVETPAPEVTTVYTEENTENNPETEEPTETETTAENPDDNHNEQEEMPLAEDTAGDQEDIPAGEETDIESEERTETGNEGKETETAEAAGEEAVTEENKEEIPPAPEKNYTSGNLQAETEGCSVQINYTEAACIPDETTLTVTQARGADLYAALKSAAKVIRNDEDEIWKRQIADEGNAFYLLSLTDAEGNEVYPGAQVELILEQKNRPDGTTCFLTGENARILDEEEGKISVTDYSMEPVGYATIQLIQTGIVTKEYSGADYIVTASYGPEANFPANTEMKVREIRPDTPEYALYSGLTEEALAEEWNEITLERYFDITFISGGKEVEPSGNVDVQIVFKDVIELTEEHDIQAVHFENKEAVVIESETDSIDEEAKRSEEVIDTVSFTSDSFSVFGVVQRTKITQKMLAADGNTYEINVTYGPDAGIPENAELLVEEIIPGSDLWEAYRKQTAAALGADDVRLPGLYDISILVDGQKIEPLTSVNVSVRLVNAESGEELHVVHFTEELPEKLVVSGDKQTEVQSLATEERIASEKITDAVVEGDTVTFDTDGFSVYAFAYTVVVYYRTVSGENYRITLDYGPDSGIPAGAELQVEELLPGDERYTEYLEKALRTITASENAGGPVDENVDEAAENEADGEDKEEIIEDIFIPEDQYARFFDIEIRADGQKIEPTGSVSVTFELVDAPEDRQDELKVIHFTGETTEIIDAAVSADAGILFETDSFSVYGVVTFASDRPAVIDLDGRSVTISRNGHYITSGILTGGNANRFNAGDSSSAIEWTFEDAGQPGKYYIYTLDDHGIKQYMNLVPKAPGDTRAHAALSDSPQPFTVTRNDNTYLFATDEMDGKTYYLNDFRGETGFAGWHGSNSGENRLTLNFTDLVIGSGTKYMTLVKYDGKYYIVNNSGTLTEVQYNPVTKMVATEDPLLWEYQEHPNGNLLFINTEGKTFNGPGGTADSFYRQLIDPHADSGVFTEDANHQNGVNESRFVFEGNHIKSHQNNHQYLGVELDENGVPVRISGNKRASEAVDILFASVIDVTVPSYYAKNHAVTHLDVSVHGNAQLDYPLPRGTYYDENGNVLYTVTRENPKTISMQEPVPITKEDIKNADIIATDVNGNELDNAFYVSGYTGNQGDENPDMPTQIRIEGSFLVANNITTPYSDSWNWAENEHWGEMNGYWTYYGWQETGPNERNLQANSTHQQIRQQRLANEITYTVTTTKMVEFTLTDGNQVLYDQNGQPIKVEVPVTMTGSCSYWSQKNTCPGIDNNGGRGADQAWAQGCIVGDAGPASSGIDFTLGGSTKQQEDAYPSVDITKYIVDENGTLLAPAESFRNSFTLYQIENSSQSSEYNTDYSAYTEESTLDIQVSGGVGKNYYDLNVPSAMIYIEEDKDSIPETITVDGIEQRYMKTVIETEYVRRESGNQPNHSTDELTPEGNEHYNSIPELAGKYLYNNEERNNAILNFYVYNVYSTPTEIEVAKTWSDHAEHYDGQELTLTLVRYKKDSQQTQETGTLILTHNVTGLENLPDGFSYTATGSSGGVYPLHQGANTLPLDIYTIAVSDSGVSYPEGYTYEGTEVVNQTVALIDANQPAEVTVNSAYHRNAAADNTTVILYIAYNNNQDRTSNTGYTLTVPKNSVVNLSCTSFYVSQHDIRNADVSLMYWKYDEHYPHWVKIQDIGRTPMTNQAIQLGNEDAYCVLIEMGAELRNTARFSLTADTSGRRFANTARTNTTRAIRARAAGAAVTRGEGSDGLPDEYILDTAFTRTVTVTEAGNWRKLVDRLPIYDGNGDPYYYAVVEGSVPEGYEVSYSPSTPVNAAETEGVTLTVHNEYQTTGKLMVSKTVGGNAGDFRKKFRMTVTAKDADGNAIPDGTYGDMAFVNGSAEFTLSHGESAIARDLPDGTVFTVSEDPDGYESEREGSDGTVHAGETKHVSFTNTLNTSQFYVMKKWVSVVDPDDMPTVYFTLMYYVEGQQPHEAQPYNGYENIPLQGPDWTWACPEELPEEINGRRVTYYAKERTVEGNNMYAYYDMSLYDIPDNLIDQYMVIIDGYENSFGASMDGNDQPYNAGIQGNAGIITIRNRTPKYLQMDVKKKFLEYVTDSNGATSLYTTTQEAVNQRNMVIEVQMMRRVIDEREGHSNEPLTDWVEYGNSFKVGYLTGSDDFYISNDNVFQVEYAGSAWAFRIPDTNTHRGLPGYGFYKLGDTLIPVRFQYVFKEVQVYDGNMNPSGGQWTSWLPDAWDANGNRIHVSAAETGQDSDRLLNVRGTALNVEKEWNPEDGITDVEEVYVKIWRRVYGSGEAYVDYLDLIRQEMNTMGTLAMNHFETSGGGVFDAANNRLILKKSGDWKAVIDRVEIFPHGNHSAQYEYRIEEIGYKDSTGEHTGTEEYAPVVYSKKDGEDASYVDHQDWILPKTEGTNHLKVTNTLEYGSLEINKQVTEESEDAAADESFAFNVSLTLPDTVTPDEAANLEAILNVEGGTISGYTLSDRVATFTLTRQGTGTTVIEGIPFGTTYEVTEAAVPGWEKVGTEVYSDQDRKKVERTDETPDTVTVTNRINAMEISVEKEWKLNGETIDWPEGFDTITVGLYQSVENAEPSAVTDGDTARTLTFGNGADITDRTFMDLPVYDTEGKQITYSIRELSVNTGAESYMVTDDTVTVTGEHAGVWNVAVSEPADGLVTVTNSTAKTDINILKIDTETEQPLSGAVFKLEKLNAENRYDTVEESITVGAEEDDKGKAVMTGLTDGDYRLTETKAPAGYISLAQRITFTIVNGQASFDNNNYAVYTPENNTLTIHNKAGLALPSTGGSGTLPYTAGGLSLILMAVLLKLMKKRRKNYQ